VRAPCAIQPGLLSLDHLYIPTRSYFLNFHFRFRSSKFPADFPWSQYTMDNTTSSVGSSKPAGQYRGRVRSGCLTCGTRKVKCDDINSQCNNCARLKRICFYQERSRQKDSTLRGTAPASPVSNTSQYRSPPPFNMLSQEGLFANQIVQEQDCFLQDPFDFGSGQFSPNVNDVFPPVHNNHCEEYDINATIGVGISVPAWGNFFLSSVG
jgi:hypothetical protein